MTAKIISVDHQFDSVTVNVEYSDGTNKIMRTYNFRNASDLETNTLKTFIKKDLDNLEALYPRVVELRTMTDKTLDFSKI